MRIGRIHTCYAVGILKFLFLFFVFCCCTKCQIRVEKMKRIFFCRKKEKPSLQAHTHQPDPITLYNWSNRRTDERMNRRRNRRTNEQTDEQTNACFQIDRGQKHECDTHWRYLCGIFFRKNITRWEIERKTALLYISQSVLVSEGIKRV